VPLGRDRRATERRRVVGDEALGFLLGSLLPGGDTG
jgi:hypothetical protein